MPRHPLIACAVIVVCLLAIPAIVASQSNYSSDYHIVRPPDDALPLKSAFGSKWQERDITVRGRIVYDRPPHGSSSSTVTIGVDNAEVEVHDQDPIISEVKVSGYTDADGNFSLTFTWHPVAELEANPDIYVKVKSQNGHVRVEDPIVELIAYSWKSGTTNKFKGTDLDLGTLKVDSDVAAFHILTDVTRAWRWSNDRGYNVPFVEAKWPSTDALETHYSASTQTLHIRSDDSWDEITHVHEYCHHWTNAFGVFVVPTYLDPHCGIFAHCAWCSENETAAFIEGWADWLSDTIVQSFVPPSSTRDPDVQVGIVKKCSEDNTFNDAYITEGFFAALLRDIEDDDNEEDMAFPGDGLQDRLSLGTDEILAVAHLDVATTTSGFLNAFIARYPSLACDLWETARNNGFNTPPGPVTELSAGPAGGPLGCGDGYQKLRFEWTLPTENWSCIAGYSVLIAATAQLPDAVQDIGAVTSYESGCLPGPAVYFFNIRARDTSGLWSNQFASYRFEFYGIPTLTFRPVLTSQRVGSDVQLTWTSGITTSRCEYDVYRGTEAGAQPSPQNYLASVVDTHLIDTGAPGTVLFYTVVARNAEGQSMSSSQVRVDATSDRGTPALTAFTVRQNQPNPFSTSTELQIGLVEESSVTVDVFDVLGRQVASLAPRTLGLGWQRIVVESRDDNGRPLPSGVYFYRVRVRGSEVIHKMVVAR